MVAVDLAISKEVDAFHPHKQARLYGIATALSQCPQGNSPVLLPSRAEGAHISLLPVRPLAALTTWRGTQPLPSRVFIISWASQMNQ